MRVRDLEVGDVMRTALGEWRLLVRVEEKSAFDAWLTWLVLDAVLVAGVKRFSYSLDEHISSACEVIRRGEALKLS